MYPESRSSDRKVHYTMKTPRSAPPPSSHTGTHSFRTKACTPVTSPRAMAHSMGQAHPPRLSPGTKSRPSSGTAQEARTSSPSYFGLVVEQSADPRESPRDSWSPPSSSVKSFTAAMPKPVLPVEANPAYDAFRKQADANHCGRTFTLNSPFQGTCPKGVSQTMTETSTIPSPKSPLLERRLQTVVDAPTEAMATPATPNPATTPGPIPSSVVVIPQDTGNPSSQMDVDATASRISAEPKWKLAAPQFSLSIPVHNSNSSATADSSKRHPCLSNIYGKIHIASAKAGAVPQKPSFDSTQSKANNGIEMVDVEELEKIIELSASEDFPLLLLDVRVSTYYATSRIQGALNLCIPTTLLKRATFNLKKMQLTFAHGDQEAKFSGWRDARYIVVYDTSSAENRDALAATNMLRKFISEGYKGHACVLRGGFKAFEAACPRLVDHQASTNASSGSAALSLNTGRGSRPAVPPIIGGVMLPSASATPNPFFSNIRQNMDLADGVGRLEISIPTALDMPSLPSWLRAAVDPADRGQRVSERFLRIELAEQARMKHAYAVFNPSAHSTSVTGNVQLSGIEKGGKNRYKDILPFEHARVRLQGRSSDSCDYVNASHIRASRSFKRYIASQGPLPATFDDFWSMIWDQDVRVIVMLTAESEGGQLKCHTYWTEKEYGPIKMRLLSEKKVSLDADKHGAGFHMSSLSHQAEGASKHKTAFAASELGRRRANTLATVEGNKTTAPSTSTASPHQASVNAANVQGETPFVVIRKFALSHSSFPFQPYREVTHLHYPSWPDFGVPAQPSHLLALVELANMMQTSTASGASKTSAATIPSRLAANLSLSDSGSVPKPWTDEAESNIHSRPMLVHCSAGCGRTGTFCTVDSVIDMLKRQNRQVAKNSMPATGEQKQPHVPQDVLMSDGSTEPGSSSSSGDVSMSGTGANENLTAAGIPSMVKPDEANTEWGGVFDPSWLDNDSVDLIAKTVEDFRKQRLSMVQSLRQFVLCYETIAEWVSRTQKARESAARGSGRPRSESLRMG